MIGRGRRAIGEGMSFIPVSTADEALAAVLGPRAVPALELVSSSAKRKRASAAKAAKARAARGKAKAKTPSNGRPAGTRIRPRSNRKGGG